MSILGKSLSQLFRELMVKQSKIAEQQGTFRKGEGCVDQMFTMKHVSEQYLDKDEELFVAFMDLEKYPIGRIGKQCDQCYKCMELVVRAFMQIM